MTEFLSSLERGELCVVTIIQWLQDTWPEYYVRSIQQINCKEMEVDRMTKREKSKDEELSRMWLYMHHIYSKTKRKHILDWAHDLKLTGFSLPGKPGVVCIEGNVKDTEDYFSRLRRLNWKKITCRHNEKYISERKFENFKELVFHVHGAGDDRMNMGEFFQFLLKRELGEMFKILFGIEGKLNH
ncbi:RWD domain-containing protein 2B-like [Dendronephthya gigantea]|uniref:RWD domain-containing protein 2B-like n=1 Tax=Dendronephthya gigantea TaxID=151771 RepID=UPI00106AB63C|nr:RWD domain-containing protein 2B-like [Dendronephthya gigantea]